MNADPLSLNNIPEISGLKDTDQLLVLYYDDGKYTWRRITSLDISNFSIDKSDITQFEYTYSDLSLGIDNVPVDGQVNEPISSNWAYDHANNQYAHWTEEQVQDQCGNMFVNTGNVTFVYDDDSDQIYANVEKGDGYLYAGNVSVNAPSFTNNNDGTVTVGDTSVVLYDNANYDGNRISLEVSEKTLTLPNDGTSFIYIEYSAGSAVYGITEDQTSINVSNKIPIYTIWVNGTNVSEILSWENQGQGLAEKLFKRSVFVDRFTHERGLAITVSSLNVSLTSGYVWYGDNRVSIDSFDSTVDTMNFYYYDGVSWVNSGATSDLNNTQYNPPGGLTALNNNYFNVNYIYKSIANGDVIYLLGNSQYNKFGEALSDTIPSNIPDIIKYHYILVARVIYKKDDADAFDVASFFTEVISSTGVTSHSNLGDLYGSSDLYHVSSSVYDALHDANAQLTDLHTDGTPTFGNTTIQGWTLLEQQADDNGLAIKGYDDVSTVSLKSYVKGTGVGVVESDYVLALKAGTTAGSTLGLTTTDDSMMFSTNHTIRINDYDDSSDVANFDIANSLFELESLNLQLNSNYISNDGSDAGLSFESTNGAVFSNEIQIGSLAGSSVAGKLRWTGSDFEGYDGSNWLSLTSGGSSVEEITQSSHGFDNDFIYHNGTSWVKAQADSADTCATHFAVNIDTDNFYLYSVGEIDSSGMTDDSSSSLTAGNYYYLSQSTAGKVTGTKPTSGIIQSVLKENGSGSASILIEEPYDYADTAYDPYSLIRYQSAAPTASDEVVYIDSDENRLKVYDNSSSSWITTGITVYVNSSEPSGGTYYEGDIWVDNS